MYFEWNVVIKNTMFALIPVCAFKEMERGLHAN